MSAKTRTPKGSWDELSARLSGLDFSRCRLLVALDFDGTLSELVTMPDQAVLAAGTRRLLARLSRRPDTKVAVISGRALDDVRSRVALPGLYYAGNHGLEIDGPGIRWTHPRAAGTDAAFRRELDDDFRDFPGALVEHKRLGFAVHYRGVPPGELPRLRRRLKARLPALTRRYRLLRAKKTYDFRLDVPWGKGDALRAIRRTLKGAWSAMFVGDDATDEEAFAAIGPRALTVRIGRVEDSAAQYVLPRRALVDRLLDGLTRRPGAGAPPEGGHELV